MISLRAILTLSLVALTFIVGSFSIYTYANDEEIYNRMVTIKGHVQILNHPELGKTAGSMEYIVFQRDGCKDCLVGVYADIDGNYQVRVGKGKYKVIAYNPSPPAYDRIAPTQVRFVTAVSPIEDTKFDIDLIVKSDNK